MGRGLLVRNFGSFAALVALGLICGSTLLVGRAAAQQQVQITSANFLANAVSDAGSGQYKEVDSALEEFFTRRNIAAARDLLKAAKKKFSKLPPAEIMLGQMLALANQGAMARQELERGIVENPKDPEFNVIFGRMALQDGRFTDAELEFTKAEALNAAFNENPKRKRNFTLDILGGLATVAESRNKPEYWQIALDRLTALLKEDPDQVQAQQRMGLALFRLNKPEQALQAFKAAAEAGQRTKVKVLPAEVLMGTLYEEAGKNEEAQRLMMSAAKAAPTDLDTQLAVANWALTSGRLEDAQKLADAAIRIDPKSVDAQVTRGVVARLLSDLRTAEDCFNTAFQIAPTGFNATNQLALVLIEQGDKDKQRRALELAERNQRQFPTNREAAATLGWVYYILGRYDDAERTLGAAAAGGALSPDAAYYIAKIFEQKNKIGEAKLLLQQALDTKKPFVHRRDAEALRTSLENKSDTSSQTPGK